MPASNAASVHARVCSSPTPPAKVSHEPSEISETSSSEEPSLRYLTMLLLAAGTQPAGGQGCRSVVDWAYRRASTTLAEHRAPPQARRRCGGTPSGGASAPAAPSGRPGPGLGSRRRLVQPREQLGLAAASGVSATVFRRRSLGSIRRSTKCFLT